MLPQDTSHVGSRAIFRDSMDCLTADAQSTQPAGRRQEVPQGHSFPSRALHWPCDAKLTAPAHASAFPSAEQCRCQQGSQLWGLAMNPQLGRA